MGVMPTVLEKARARRDSAVLGLFTCQPFWPPGTTRRKFSGTPIKNKKEFSHVHDMFPLRLPHSLCSLTERQLADLAALYQC